MRVSCPVFRGLRRLWPPSQKSLFDTVALGVRFELGRLPSHPEGTYLKLSESLVNGGELILEHGYDQRNDLMELLEEYPYFGPPECFDDLEGRPRVMKLIKH